MDTGANHYFFQEALDNINLFSVMTIMSFMFLAPAAIFMEGFKFTPSYLQSAVSNIFQRTEANPTEVHT